MAGYRLRGMTRSSMQILILLALPSLLAAKDCVQGVTYLDPVTGNCDPCNDICDHAIEQGTRARCDRMCKGYKVADQCPRDHYFDQNVGRCDHCDTICLPPQQDDCSQFCPDWAKSTERSPVSIVQDHTTDHLPTPTSHVGQNSDNTDGSKIIINVLTAIGVLIAVLIVVGLICFGFGKPLANRIKTIVGGRCRRRAIQEHGETASQMLQKNPPIVTHPEDEIV